MACATLGSFIFGQKGCGGDEELVPVWCMQGDGEAPLEKSHQSALGGDGGGCLCPLSPTPLGLHNSTVAPWGFTTDPSEQRRRG